MGIAKFIIGPAEGRTRWLHPSYALQLSKLKAYFPSPGNVALLLE
jgi:hypothetical protein